MPAPQPRRPRRAPTAAAAERSAGPPAVQLNPADCDLDFSIWRNGLEGDALTERGFAYCWSGARATFGITHGMYYFGCKVTSKQEVAMPGTPANEQHGCIVGISRGDEPVGDLGESMNSLGYSIDGKFLNGDEPLPYVPEFTVGDTIVCYVNIDGKSASVGFSKNGRWLGFAKTFDAGPEGLNLGSRHENQPWKSAIFPNVVLRNMVVQLDFSSGDGLSCQKGYKPWVSAVKNGDAVIGHSFSSSKPELVMMVGLPGSGKSTLAEKLVKEYPEKRYIVLGTNLALKKMKVPGHQLKQNYGERFDYLMDRATGILNSLLGLAAKRPHNYIIDQANVCLSARNHKLKIFPDYHKVALVVFPEPNVFRSRANWLNGTGKNVPIEAVNEMLENFVLPMEKDMPGSVEFFDEVDFKELDREKVQINVDKMKGKPELSDANAKIDLSSYSSEIPVQSFSSDFRHEESSC